MYSIIHIACTMKHFMFISATCETIGSRREPCVFPFKYGGQTFNRCTSTDAETGSVWCATKVDDEGVVVEGRWGDCSEGCPGAREYNKLTIPRLQEDTFKMYRRFIQHGH